ncbi:sulfur carrier protein ThiS [Halobacillus campisalis]|uniref:Sulfur carrier protein ThiS n=1 Tax=Halobacillus campisalis TaxID=435909 RepID=A0ABW2K3F3_9BACI|nr:sulfur carrier protein ThiS [Halobacillus campisalis]
MNIQVNGRRIQLNEHEITIGELLESYNVTKRISVVEHNKEIIKKEEYEQTKITNGDTLEIVHFVGGG